MEEIKTPPLFFSPHFSVPNSLVVRVIRIIAHTMYAVYVRKRV
jgi:hypothetical protein